MEINNSLKKKNSFYCVGGMGHAISIENGIAIKKKKKRVQQKRHLIIRGN